MTDKETIKILKNLSNISTKDSDKKSFRVNLERYIESNPVRNVVSDRQIVQGVKPQTRLLIFRPMLVSIVLAITLAISGGISYAAEGSLPGDPLYNIKTNINERVRGAVAVSAESEAKWQNKLVERRLQEASKLAQDNRLDSETSVSLASKVNQHSSRSQSLSSSLAASGKTSVALEISSELEAILNSYTTTLNTAKSEVELNVDQETSLQVLIDEVVETKTETIETQTEIKSETKVDVEVEADLKTKAQMLKNQAEELETRVDNKINTLVSEGWQVNVTVESKIVALDQLMIKASSKFQTEAYVEAIQLYQQAMASFKELLILLESDVKFDVDLDFDADLLEGKDTGLQGTATGSLGF